MQASTRPRPQPGAQRRQHGPQISISDDQHHVTDAISSLYGYGEHHQSPNNDEAASDRHAHEQLPPRPRSQRPLSFLPSAKEEITHSLSEGQEDARKSGGKPLGRAKTLEGGIRTYQRPSHYTNRQYVVGRSISAPHEPALSPATRSPADTATSSFPLNDIDYESSPAAVAQELSNLQAIRRMSMNVDAAGDPDLPSFGVPSLPSSGDEDSDDPSRLFWVPASLHPELAPKEFKTFIDGRVESLKRRSGEFNVPNDQPARSTSGGGLRRKKSMLSRQIDNSDGKGAEGYQDGAERLDRKRSSTTKDKLAASGMANLHELEVLVTDQTSAMSRLSMDTKQQEGLSPMDEDMPILPLAPGGNSLKRSTRTTYRRGSMKDGKRFPPSKRAAGAIKSPEAESEDPSETSPTGPGDAPGLGIARVQTEPPLPSDRQLQEKPTENFSRPGRSSRRVASPTSPPAIALDPNISQSQISPRERAEQKSPPPPTGESQSTLPPITTTNREPKPFVSQIASNGRTTARVPAHVDPTSGPDSQRPQSQQDYRPPERVSSHQPISFSQPQQSGVSQVAPPPVRSSKRMPGPRSGQQNEQANQTLQHMAAHPSPLPGNSTRTDSLSFIPTLTEDKRAEPKREGTKRSGWGAFGSWLGGDERERERRKEEEARDAREAEKTSKKSKLKLGKASDSGRLDVLQTTMDCSRGRESLVLERGDVRLEEERRKESTRKSSESRKEKDGIFTKMSGLFGDSKKKPDRENSGKKVARSYSPEPPRPVLKPDVDYNWTRFSIIEERAIYRMAHIKLANPRRPLYSQVLLSNFMYSYLAKVQQMHPQIQIPQSAAAKAQQRAQQQQKKADQPEEFYQYQRYQEQLQEQDRATQQAVGQPPIQESNENADYMDDSQSYDYDHGDAHDSDLRTDQEMQQGMTNGDGNYTQDHGYSYPPQEHSPYQYHQAQFDDPGRTEDDDMW